MSEDGARRGWKLYGSNREKVVAFAQRFDDFRNFGDFSVDSIELAAADQDIDNVELAMQFLLGTLGVGAGAGKRNVVGVLTSARLACGLLAFAQIKAMGGAFVTDVQIADKLKQHGYNADAAAGDLFA